MKSRGVLLVMTAMLLCGYAGAAESKILGEGNKTCAEWTAAVRSGGAEGLPMQAWLRGYVTALTDQKEVDAGDLIGWVDQFCKANAPVSLYYAAREYLLLKVSDPKHPLHI